ncbi:MAG: chemotaxis protein CheR [Planctomycetota bacterium]|jgi:chemotaxis protein methyltransferase CheR|nr:chemotaxis protein CheR [Planctomycetota bacterium]
MKFPRSRRRGRPDHPEEINPLFLSPGTADSGGILESLGIELIPEREFRELAAIISRHFGIKVGKNKLTLVTGRIHPIMERHGFDSYGDYVQALKEDQNGNLLSELANHISTNHTGFYREDAHFAVLMKKVLPDIVARKNRMHDRDLRVWCAACSTGEEAYTIQFCLLKHFGIDYKGWRAGVLATDLSTAALDKAKAGRYAAQRVGDVPPDILARYFHRVDEDTYEVAAAVRSEVTFRRLNLTRRDFPLKKQFDIIFCRNVMIYFDPPTRRALVEKFRNWLEDGGYLFIGHSESISWTADSLRYIAPSVYAKTKG